MVEKRIRLSKSAQSWLVREIEYLAARNLAAAKRLAKRIRDAKGLLSQYPKGSQAGQIHGTRRLVISPYIMTIRDKDGVIEIAAIRHAQQGDAYAPKDLLEDEVSP